MNQHKTNAYFLHVKSAWH